MAKGLRSKSKRSFRRIKRDSGTSAYALADAARLQRLSSKLRQKIETDKDGDTVIDEVVEGVEKSEESGEGWYWFALFGLIPPSLIKADYDVPS